MHAAAVYFGYFASLMLIMALLVSSDLKFRWFNTAGNVSFITYALILQAFPVLITNCILLSINVFYLVKVYGRKEKFDIVSFQGDEKLAGKFIRFYHNDMLDFFPQFREEDIPGNLNFVVLRDLVIANIFSAKLQANGDAEVLLNYTLKKYRDFKVGQYIFDQEKEFLISKGVKRIVYKTAVNRNHLRFLKVMGFKTETIDGVPGYAKVL